MTSKPVLAHLHARAVDSGVVPMLLSHYEHALDEADPAKPGPPLPAFQRARGLSRARVIRDVLAAFGDASACTSSRDERLARLEAGAETP